MYRARKCWGRLRGRPIRYRSSKNCEVAQRPTSIWSVRGAGEGRDFLPGRDSASQPSGCDFFCSGEQPEKGAEAKGYDHGAGHEVKQVVDRTALFVVPGGCHGRHCLGSNSIISLNITAKEIPTMGQSGGCGEKVCYSSYLFIFAVKRKSRCPVMDIGF